MWLGHHSCPLSGRWMGFRPHPKLQTGLAGSPSDLLPLNVESPQCRHQHLVTFWLPASKRGVTSTPSSAFGRRVTFWLPASKHRATSTPSSASGRRAAFRLPASKRGVNFPPSSAFSRPATFWIEGDLMITFRQSPAGASLFLSLEGAGFTSTLVSLGVLVRLAGGPAVATETSDFLFAGLGIVGVWLLYSPDSSLHSTWTIPYGKAPYTQPCWGRRWCRYLSMLRGGRLPCARIWSGPPDCSARHTVGCIGGRRTVLPLDWHASEWSVTHTGPCPP